MNKKAIAPVVTISLILVIVILAVLNYDTFYNSLSTKLEGNVEANSNSALDEQIVIDKVLSQNLYIYSDSSDEVPIISLTVNKVKCDINKNLVNGLNEINISSCFTSKGYDKVLVSLVTKYGTQTKAAEYSNVQISLENSLDCSGLNGGDWIEVPGNSDLGTSDFCVMKYEAKCIEKTEGYNCDEAGGDTIISQANNTPWTSISRTWAKSECDSLDDGTGDYHLITNVEWVTIARLAENNKYNWNSTTIGDGTLAKGWASDAWSNTAAAPYSNLSCLYNVGVDTCGATGDFIYRRTLNISGNLIWDFSGNVWEWTNDSLETTGSENSSLGTGTTGWFEWSNINGYLYLKPTNSLLNSTHGIGQAGTDHDSLFPAGDTHVFLKGGYWGYGQRSGLYSLDLNQGDPDADSSRGFRCTYTP